MKLTSYRLGILAEWIAILLLKIKGYHILKTRYQRKLGEIDIIARKKTILIAVEVKWRKKASQIEGALLSKQRRRIENALLLFLKSYTFPYQGIRFDLILILPYQWPKHIKDAWRTGE